MSFVKDIKSNSYLEDREELKFQISELKYHCEAHQKSLIETDYHLKKIDSILKDFERFNRSVGAA
jgi:hypothetical protein